MFVLTLLACGTELAWDFDAQPEWPCSCAPPEPDPSWVEEDFPQLAAARTDVFLVIDPALAEVAVELLPLLAGRLDEVGTDWQIGLVSAALDADLEIPTGGWIGAADPLPTELVLAGTDLRPLEASALAFTDPRLAISGDSAVQVLFVVGTDDDAGDADAWAASFEALRPAPRDRSVAVLAPEEAITLRSLASDDEPVGTVADLPAFAFGAARVAVGVTRIYALSLLPLPHTLELQVHDTTGAVLDFDLEDDLLYDPARNSVRFMEYWPVAGAVIEARYRIELEPSDD